LPCLLLILRSPLPNLDGLLLHLIKQHGCEQLIFNREYLTVLVVRDHLGIDLGHFFGDQAILQEVRSIVLPFVEAVHRTQLEQLAAIVARRRSVP